MLGQCSAAIALSVAVGLPTYKKYVIRCLNGTMGAISTALASLQLAAGHYLDDDILWMVVGKSLYLCVNTCQVACVLLHL